MLIGRGERHEIRNTGGTPLKTLNFYVPPAYTGEGDELTAGKGWTMSKQTLAILIGGLLPALLYGVAGVLQKTASKTGIGPGPYILVIGVVAAVIGGAITLISRDTSITWTGAAHTAGFAVLWAGAVVSIMLALGRYEGPVSVIVPLCNTNTWIAVLLGLFLLGEWSGVNGWRLVAGAVLIVAGGALAGTAVK